LIFETIKSFYISKKQLNKRFSYKNKFEEYAKHKTSFIFMLSHTGNWELANLFMSLHSPVKVVVVYKKISNELLNRFMLKKRSRFGSVMVEMNDIAKFMLLNKNENLFYVFLCDQTPLPKNAYWDFFLNQETPFLKGAAILAKKMQYPVIYGNTIKIKRGVYQTSTKNITDIPNTIDEKEILHTFIKNLETDICNQPEFWLWSHKRWKHKKTDL
jgi:KDO2-lipid IV(A) lauroyltransferase